TAAGKQRSSRNALKHGLCAATAIPDCEDGPTFSMHCDELFKELKPATVLQKILFQQIAQLIWNLRRLPEAQAALFQLELDKESEQESGRESESESESESEPGLELMTPSQLLARRFSN